MNREYKINITNEEPSYLQNMPIKDMLCKHVLNIGSQRTADVIKFSNLCGYNYVIWGEHNGHPFDFEYHNNVIKNMERDNYFHPIRIVVCNYDFSNEKYVWADNLHSVIRLMRHYGAHIKLKDVPHYIVDITDKQQVTLISSSNSIRNNISDVIGAINCAYKRRQRSNNEPLIRLQYSIRNFMTDNPDFFYIKNL